MTVTEPLEVTLHPLEVLKLELDFGDADEAANQSISGVETVSVLQLAGATADITLGSATVSGFIVTVPISTVTHGHEYLLAVMVNWSGGNRRPGLVVVKGDRGK